MIVQCRESEIPCLARKKSLRSARVGEGRFDAASRRPGGTILTRVAAQSATSAGMRIARMFGSALASRLGALPRLRARTSISSYVTIPFLDGVA